MRRSWDRRAWKDARPDKIVPTDGTQLVAAWRQQLHDLGYRTPSPQRAFPMVVGAPRVGEFNRDAAVATILVRLGARRSGWNPADIRGEAEKQIAATGLVADAAVRVELAEDLTARVIEACEPLLNQPDVPEHVRSLSSPLVLAVEADLVTRLASRAETPTAPATVPAAVEGLDDAQRSAVEVLAGDAKLVVVEGAAGAGKTTTLAATKTALEAQGRRMLVVTPTLKAAQVAAREVGRAGSVAWLVHQHGFRWDDDGRWTRQPATPATEARLSPGDLLLIDEAGMLDQDTAKALLTVADETGARVAFVGDRHQLPAVGRGGVLDLAARWVRPEAHLDLDVVHRFADPEYAAISLALRTGATTHPLPGKETGEQVGKGDGEVWDALCRRNQVRIYPSEAERAQALARVAVEAILTSRRDTFGTVVMADTREQAATLSGAIRDRLIGLGQVEDIHAVVTRVGERVGVGDRVATRRNDRDLGVTNRQTWNVIAVGSDGSLTLRGRRATDQHVVPASYAREHVELAYATTVYGAQGETAGTGHLLLGEHTSAASAYVAMTRGRFDNIVHIVAENVDDARRQWDDVLGRDRADLGPAVAAQRAIEDVDRYGTQIPVRGLDEVMAELRAAWAQQADLTERKRHLVGERDALQQVSAIRARYAPHQQRLHAEQSTAKTQWLDATSRVDDLDTTLASETADLRSRLWDAWRKDLAQAKRAAGVVDQGTGRFGQRRRQVHAATDELAAFGQRWRPVHPDLPTDPADLALQVRWLHGQRVEDQITAYVTRRVAEAHPDADICRQTVRTAWAAYETAEKARTRLDNTLYAELRPYGHAAHVPDPAGRLTTVSDQLGVVERDLQTATAAVDSLRNEPAVRALPAGGAGTEYGQWAAVRAAQQKAAREAQVRWQRQQQSHRIQPNPPGHPRLDYGTSIGR